MCLINQMLLFRQWICVLYLFVHIICMCSNGGGGGGGSQTHQQQEAVDRLVCTPLFGQSGTETGEISELKRA